MDLSKASGLYPKSLVLENISMENDARTRGGFGDVHKGFLERKGVSLAVAVKVLRVYQDVDSSRTLKVTSTHQSIYMR